MCWPTSQDAKSMTARSPDDSAGEHNKGSGWTSNSLTEGRSYYFIGIGLKEECLKDTVAAMSGIAAQSKNYDSLAIATFRRTIGKASTISYQNDSSTGTVPLHSQI